MMMKNFCIALLMIATALTLFSCTAKESYRDDLSCDELADIVAKSVPEEGGYSAYGEDHIEFFFEDTTLPDSYSLLYSKEVNDIGEFGIFHCPDADSTEALYDVVSRYVEDQRSSQRAFVASYAPREVRKLDGAEVRAYGNYVIYLMLDGDEKQAALDAIESALKE